MSEPNGNGSAPEMLPNEGANGNVAVDAQLRVLEADILLDRLRFMRQAGITFGGARDLYEAFGYDRIITTKQYRDRYARGGIAGRIVDALPNATWRGTVELIEDENPDVSTVFEEAWTALDERLKVTATLCRVDKLSRLSTYAILLIGTSVAGELDTELPKGSKQEQIIFLSPFPGGGGPGFSERMGVTGDMSSAYTDATIRELDKDTRSPRFGLPLYYQLRRLDASNPAFMKPVHWSRVIHVAENCLDNEVYGQPALERCWNLLDDLDKITGGGAEAFYLRANPGIHLDVDKDMKLADAKDDLNNLKDQIDRWRHNMSDRAFRTKGVTIDMLASDVSNFQSPADAVLTQIAGSTSMPKRILTGSEMGELASSQDRDNWKDQVNGRQTGHAGPNILRQLADRLITYGYLPKPKDYEVRWAHIQTMTEQEKAEGAAKWATVNSTAGFTVFSDAEIREHWYDMEPSVEADTDAWRTELALKMATTNKAEGAVIFTNDEIRDVCFGWAPLTDAEKVPITAPERVSATAPTPPDDQVGGKGTPPPAPKGQPGAFPRAAEDVEVLRVLERAIETNNTDVIDAIIGVRHLGGAGSGNFGHEGRKGEVGGSGAGGGESGHAATGGRPYDAMRAYVQEYQAHVGIETRLSATQAQKVHKTLQRVEKMLHDPEVGHIIIQALRAVNPSAITKQLELLETGMARFVGGHAEEPPARLYLDRRPIAKLEPHAAAAGDVSPETVLNALRELLAALNDSETGDAAKWFIEQVVNAGGVDEYDQSLQGNA